MKRKIIIIIIVIFVLIGYLFLGNKTRIYKSQAESYKHFYDTQKQQYQDSINRLNIDLKITQNRLKNRNIEILKKNCRIEALKRSHGKKISDIDNISADSSKRFIADKYRLEKNP